MVVDIGLRGFNIFLYYNQYFCVLADLSRVSHVQHYCAWCVSINGWMTKLLICGLGFSNTLLAVSTIDLGAHINGECPKSIVL